MNNLSRFSRLSWLQAEMGQSGLELIRAGQCLPKPVQIEIHPYYRGQVRPCENNCLWCTRKHDRRNLVREHARGIEPDRLVEFIRSFRGCGIAEFALAGNSTEPLLFPQIERVIEAIKDVGSAFRLYTNFQSGDKLYDVAGRLEEGDIVRVSLDAGSPESYAATHRPIDGPAFDRIREKLAGLLERRQKLGGRFSVVVTYLVNQLNSAPEEIVGTMRWADSIGLDLLSFARPLAPFGDKGDFQPLSDAQALELSGLVETTKNRMGSATRFYFSDAEDEETSKPFRNCHYWKVAAVLGSRGMFFPCTSTATADYASSLGRSDIHDPSFDFWEFWHDAGRWSGICPGNCPECTRVEWSVNNWVEEQTASRLSAPDCPAHA